MSDSSPDAAPDRPDATTDDAGPRPEPRPGGRRRGPGPWAPLLLIGLGHPGQAVLTAAAMAVAAALLGRDAREVGLVFVTVLVGQTILGWHNDVVDAETDHAHHRRGKPVSDRRIEPGTVWFAIICGVLLLVPLSISNGVIAGGCYLASVGCGFLGNLLFRRGLLSFFWWAVSFAFLPAFLSYGGWGGTAEGHPPEPVIVVLAALLGIGVHFLRSLWGLPADHEDGWTYLPLKAGLKIGATALLVVTSIYLAIVVAALVVATRQLGLAA